VVREGDQVCPYSNATRGNVEVALTANGRRVEQAPAAAPPPPGNRAGSAATSVPVR
jgi:hypothetical protein